MILLRNEIKELKAIQLEEDVELKKETLDGCGDIIKVNSIKARLEAQYISNLVMCKLFVKASLVLKSTRTLKPVDYVINEEEEITLSFEKTNYELSEDILEIKEDHYDFYDDIASLVITNIPLKIIAEDDPEYQEGENWEVISEDEYYRRKKNKDIDPRLAQFADIEIED